MFPYTGTSPNLGVNGCKWAVITCKLARILCSSAVVRLIDDEQITHRRTSTTSISWHPGPAECHTHVARIDAIRGDNSWNSTTIVSAPRFTAHFGEGFYSRIDADTIAECPGMSRNVRECNLYDILRVSYQQHKSHNFAICKARRSRTPASRDTAKQFWQTGRFNVSFR